MNKEEYVWWVDEMRPAHRGSVNAARFLLFGPYPDEETAARKIVDLRKLPRYENSDLVLSKQFGPAVGMH